jgi:hypothetical protein
MLSRNLTKKGADLWREQVHYALPIFRYEGVLSWLSLKWRSDVLR